MVPAVQHLQLATFSISNRAGIETVSSGTVSMHRAQCALFLSCSSQGGHSKHLRSWVDRTH